MTTDAPRPYDPELPILAELEERLRVLAEQRTVAGATAGAEPPDVDRTATHAGARRAGARGASRAPRAGRVARRALVLVGLVGLVGSAAVATRSLVHGDGASHGDPSLRTTRAVEIGAGVQRGETFALSAARRGRDLCDALLVEGAVATRCDAPPAPRGVLVDVLRSPRSHWVAGLAGGRVRRVEVAFGGVRREVATRPVGDPRAARGGALPVGLRWFVVAFPREDGGRPPAARVTPLR